ncbi:2-dehydro-3-deoxy-6-phosphogalactonate aldolase [Variovorax sp. VNK109]|uniref:2-dehydro-3-deoxy-6-phosphogalactonate aldolase n=1 Tax=Variovorax sp. VNK109 TaxID=3400919 RepID=UPI003C11BDE9
MPANEQTFRKLMQHLPLVAILRGIEPDEADAVGDALVGQGFNLIEVPFNSPRPLASIERLARRFPNSLVGAGTVLTVEEVRQTRDAGGRLVVSPNFDVDVVREARALGLISLPGVLTPTEAFAAMRAGAHGLKLFPAEVVPPRVVKALRAVIPVDVPLLPVGGINTKNMAEYLAQGASGFGIGSALYKPGKSAAEVARDARVFASAYVGMQAT